MWSGRALSRRRCARLLRAWAAIPRPHAFGKALARRSARAAECSMRRGLPSLACVRIASRSAAGMHCPGDTIDEGQTRNTSHICAGAGPRTCACSRTKPATSAPGPRTLRRWIRPGTHQPAARASTVNTWANGIRRRRVALQHPARRADRPVGGRRMALGSGPHCAGRRGGVLGVRSRCVTMERSAGCSRSDSLGHQTAQVVFLLAGMLAHPTCVRWPAWHLRGLPVLR
jgi:hypothetical protein